MKFYSEKLNKIFDKVEELENEEKKFTEKQARSNTIKEKYKKCIDGIAKNLNMVLNIDDSEVSIQDQEEIVTYLMEKLFPLTMNIIAL